MSKMEEFSTEDSQDHVHRSFGIHIVKNGFFVLLLTIISVY